MFAKLLKEGVPDKKDWNDYTQSNTGSRPWAKVKRQDETEKLLALAK